jgi:hypothetical protein
MHDLISGKVKITDTEDQLGILVNLDETSRSLDGSTQNKILPLLSVIYVPTVTNDEYTTIMVAEPPSSPAT